MPKNPFVNCKSRKRRKARAPIVKPKENLYCPRTMVRYDNSPSDFPTIWVCKMCTRSMLSENAVKNHLITCNASTKRDNPDPPAKKNEDTQYICETCKKVFARRVTLKKHLEVHDKSPSSIDSEQSDDEIEAMDDVDANDEDDLSNEENDDEDDDNDEQNNPCCSIDLT